MPGTIFRLPLLLLLGLLTGCTSMGTLQTPDVLEPGHVSLAFDVDGPFQQQPAEVAPAPVGGVSSRWQLHTGMVGGFEGYVGVGLIEGGTTSDRISGGSLPLALGIKAARRIGRFATALSVGHYRGTMIEPFGLSGWERATRSTHITFLAGLPLAQTPAENRPPPPFHYARPTPYAALRFTRLSTFFRYRADDGYDREIATRFAGWVPSVSLGFRTTARHSLVALECSLFYYDGTVYPTWGLSRRIGGRYR